MHVHHPQRGPTLNRDSHELPLAGPCGPSPPQIEEFEKHLIRLSKACQVNLMSHAKRATNRDFKSVPPLLPCGLCLSRPAEIAFRCLHGMLLLAVWGKKCHWECAACTVLYCPQGAHPSIHEHTINTVVSAVGCRLQFGKIAEERKDEGEEGGGDEHRQKRARPQSPAAGDGEQEVEEEDEEPQVGAGAVTCVGEG